MVLGFSIISCRIKGWVANSGARSYCSKVVAFLVWPCFDALSCFFFYRVWVSFRYTKDFIGDFRKFFSAITWRVFSSKTELEEVITSVVQGLYFTIGGLGISCFFAVYNITCC